MSPTGNNFPSGHNNLRFEEVSHCHCRVLEALHQTSFAKPWTADAFEQLLSHPGTIGWIAIQPKVQPLGMIVIRRVEDEAEILTFCVDPEYRRRNIATRMINHGLSVCRKMGSEKMFLEVAEDNRAALDLYCGCGFKIVGKRAGYYRSPGKLAKAALIMERKF